MTTKLVRVNIDLLENAKKMYEMQMNNKIELTPGQVTKMCIAHTLGKKVEIIKNKNKIIIKCSN